MIVPKKIKKMKNFIGRHAEWERLTALGQTKEPAILFYKRKISIF
jgi:hypothetical protein